MNLRAVWPCLALVAAPLPAQSIHLDATHAFFSTGRAHAGGAVVAETNAGSITLASFRSYVAALSDARSGRRSSARILEHLGFDFLLARECEARGIAKSAPALARAMAARRFLESGRTAGVDAALQARFATEAMRQLRIDALVGAARQVDETALRIRFDHTYGVDGIRVHVRHVLVRKGADALTRTRALQARLQAGESFDALLRESDDRTTRRLLRDPARAAVAGIVEGYNYRRYGEAFATAVRNLEVGAVSGPVASRVGYHLIQVVDRKVTSYEQVLPTLKKELGGGKATKSEVDALRRSLWQKHAFRIVPEVATISVTPTDWPHYRGNPQLHGVAPGNLGQKPELAWTFETEGEILSSPIIVSGTVYVGSTDNSIYAIDLATGTKRWTYPTGDMVEAPPLFLDGRIYIGSSDGVLYALDAATGELAWKFPTLDKILGGANWHRRADGSLSIVVGSYDAMVYCVDAKTGAKIWSYETDNYVHGAPAIAGNEVVFGGCDAGLHLVDAETGKRVAKVDLGQGCQVAGSVALAGDKAYFGHYGNEFLRVDLESGQTEWAYRNTRQGFVSSPAIDSKYVVVGSRDKQLHCVLRADGTPQWTFKTRRKVDGSPVICGDKVVFGSGDGRLYLLRLEDGEQLWSYDIGRPVFSSPAVSSGMIVVGAGDKRVYAFRSEPDERK